MDLSWCQSVSQKVNPPNPAVGFNLFAFYSKQLYSDSDTWTTQHVKSRVFSTISSEVDFEEARAWQLQEERSIWIIFHI
jgi:hypothetical protein